MSFADMLEDSFPHSTPEGYKRGCRGSRCRGIEDHGWSCTYAMQQYRGDYHWRQWIDQGATPEEIAVLAKARGETVVPPEPVKPPRSNSPRRSLMTVNLLAFPSAREERPKPRPLPNPAASVRPVPEVEEHAAPTPLTKWRVSRKAPGAWQVRGPGRMRTRVFPTQGEAFSFACEQATGRPAKARRRRAGETREYNRVTPEQVAAAIKLRADEVPWRELASQLGVKATTIQKAVARAQAAQGGRRRT